MTNIFDVFRLEASGPCWLESAVTLERAKARIQELAVSSPGEYLVLDQRTGNKHVFGLGGVLGTEHSRGTEAGQGRRHL